MEYRPYYLAREWVRLGHCVTVVAASESHLRSVQPATSSAYTREALDGINYIWCRTPHYSGNGVGRVINIFAFLRQLAKHRSWLDFRPDAVIASSTYPLDIFPARRIARLAKCPLVWEVHDLWPRSPIELGGMSPLHPFILLLQAAENEACRSADLVVSLLPCAKQYLVQHGMTDSKFLYIPNGIDPAEWKTEATALTPTPITSFVEKERNRGRLTIGYAGGHGISNALESMVEAASLTRDQPISWILIGKGPEKAALEAQARQAGLDNLILFDPVPKSAIPAVLRSMDVLYIGFQRQPLYRFGISPNKLMDYMMAARPIICAVEAGNDPVTEAGCGFTIPPESSQQLAAAALKFAAMSASERNNMGAAGRRFVEAQHTYPMLARRFLDAMLRLRT